MVDIKHIEPEDIFRVHVLGVGNYFSKRHWTTSFVVQCGEEFILVEAPNQPQKRFEDYKRAVKERYPGWPTDIPCLDNLVVENVPRIIVTHDHNDHSAGVQNIGLYMKTDPDVNRMIGAKRKPEIYTYFEVVNSLMDGNQMQFGFNGFKFGDFLDVRLVDALRNNAFDMGGGVTLDTRATDHGIPGFAFIMSYKGRSFSYSSDTRFSDDLIGFLAQAGTMIHECDGAPAVHTTADQLLDWQARSAYDGKLYVVHFKDEDCIRRQGLTPLPEFDYIDI